MDGITKKVVPYTGNSELRMVEGWCCKTCGKFWGDSQHMACWCCCTEVPCRDCGNPTSKSYTYCEGCRQKRERERFENLEAKPYDGSAVVTYDDNRYFFDEDSLLEYMEDLNADQDFAPGEMMLVFAECRPARWGQQVSEILCDDIAEDDEWDTSEIDDFIAWWVDENAPKVYWPTKVRVSAESLAELFKRECSGS